MKKIKANNGFTIIELIAVIIGVILLLGLLLYTHQAIAISKRNIARENNLKSIQTSLEAYYSQNGHYPSLKDINNANFRKQNLNNFNSSLLIDPSSKLRADNVYLASSPSFGLYSYQVSDSDGNSCEKDDTNCSKYTLTATYEGKVNQQKTYSRQSLN